MESGWGNGIWLSRVPAERDGNEGQTELLPQNPRKTKGLKPQGPRAAWLRHEGDTEPSGRLRHSRVDAQILFWPTILQIKAIHSGEIKAERHEGWREQAIGQKMGVPWTSACWMARPLAHCPVLLPDAGSRAHTSAILPPAPITPQRKMQGLLYREIEQLQRIIQRGSPNKKSQLATQSRYSEEKRKKQTNKLLSSLLCSLRGSYQHETQLF